MQTEEQRLINGLFSRLKDTEQKTGPRDRQAEQQISQYIHAQPAAPYYMAQALIIQEAALKQMDQRVKELENQAAQLQQNNAGQQGSGGFLAGLFGGGNRTPQAPQPTQQNNAAWGNPQYSQPQAAPSRAAGFLGGALQTAAGVAGGVVLADMLTGMFHHTQPEEIVNIINETPADNSAMQQFDAANNLDTFNNGDAGFQQADYSNDNDLTDNGFDSDFNDDDGSFL